MCYEGLVSAPGASTLLILFCVFFFGLHGSGRTVVRLCNKESFMIQTTVQGTTVSLAFLEHWLPFLSQHNWFVQGEWFNIQVHDSSENTRRDFISMNESRKKEAPANLIGDLWIWYFWYYSVLYYAAATASLRTFPLVCSFLRRVPSLSQTRALVCSHIGNGVCHDAAANAARVNDRCSALRCEGVAVAAKGSSKVTVSS